MQNYQYFPKNLEYSFERLLKVIHNRYLCTSIFESLTLEGLEKYEIKITSLQNKSYNFQFEIGNDFFVNFENSLVEKGNLKAQLILDKSESMIQLHFLIKGNIELVCDRSLEEFEYPIELDEKLILQFGERNEQITDELELIPRTTVTINVAKPMYDFISVAVPMKKLHPKFQAEEEEGELVLVYSSESSLESDLDVPNVEEETDPRWQALKKLKK